MLTLPNSSRIFTIILTFDHSATTPKSAVLGLNFEHMKTLFVIFC